MNGRAGSFVRASAVRMCTVQYPYGAWAWAEYSLPSGLYGQKLYWACALHFPHVDVQYGVRLGQSEQCILYVYVCVCGGRYV